MAKFLGAFVLFLQFLSFSTLASEPEIIITHKNSYNGFAFVAGKVVSKEQAGPVGVTVEIGGLKFSTVSDPAGNWGVVFRHIAVNFKVTAWNFTTSNRFADLDESLPGVSFIPSEGETAIRK